MMTLGLSRNEDATRRCSGRCAWGTVVASTLRPCLFSHTVPAGPSRVQQSSYQPSYCPGEWSAVARVCVAAVKVDQGWRQPPAGVHPSHEAKQVMKESSWGFSMRANKTLTCVDGVQHVED